MNKKSAWEKYPKGTKQDEVFDFAEGYRKFISDCKTERECTSFIYEDSLKNGFKDLDELITSKEKIKAGDRIVANNYGKGLALFIIGKKDIEESDSLCL